MDVYVNVFLPDTYSPSKPHPLLKTSIGAEKSFIPVSPLPFFLPRMGPQDQVIPFHACAPKFGALASTYLAIPPGGMSPRWPRALLLPSRFPSTRSVSANFLRQSYSVERCA
jgi:hypothetical protein